MLMIFEVCIDLDTNCMSSSTSCCSLLLLQGITLCLPGLYLEPALFCSSILSCRKVFCRCDAIQKSPILATILQLLFELVKLAPNYCCLCVEALDLYDLHNAILHISDGPHMTNNGVPDYHDRYQHMLLDRVVSDQRAAAQISSNPPITFSCLFLASFSALWIASWTRSSFSFKKASKRNASSSSICSLLFSASSLPM